MHKNTTINRIVNKRKYLHSDTTETVHHPQRAHKILEKFTTLDTYQLVSFTTGLVPVFPKQNPFEIPQRKVSKFAGRAASVTGACSTYAF